MCTTTIDYGHIMVSHYIKDTMIIVHAMSADIEMVICD